jgi:hypothetical protein
MRKFSKITENVESKLVVNPTKSLKAIIGYLFETTTEENNFFKYISDDLGGESYTKEFRDEFDYATQNLENLKKFLKKYDIEESAQGHVYYDMMVVYDFSQKLKPTSHYMKQINKEK